MGNETILQNDEDVAQELFVRIKEDSKHLYESNQQDINFIVNKGKFFTEAHDFDSMKIHPTVKHNLYSLSFVKPSYIQSQVTPTILNGGSVGVQSPSGTGKTIAYLLGVISAVNPGEGPQALIISPTRELNTQIAKVLDSLIKGMNLKYHLALRGVSTNEITEEIILGSPGTIITMCAKTKINPENVRLVVFDEADLLLDRERMGAQCFKLLKTFQCSQKVFISATYNDELKKTLNTYCKDLTEMYLPKNTKPDEIYLYFIEADYKQKVQAILSLIDSLIIGQCIIFVSSKKTVKNLESILKEDHNTVSILHGDLLPNERDEVVEGFKSGQSKFLVTTDVFSRGMDIPMVNLIINFDLPYHDRVLLLDTYIHRIGRSGRFGRTGFVVDLINRHELSDYLSIQQSLDTISKKFTIEALEKIHLNDN